MQYQEVVRQLQQTQQQLSSPTALREDGDDGPTPEQKLLISQLQRQLALKQEEVEKLSFPCEDHAGLPYY